MGIILTELRRHYTLKQTEIDRKKSTGNPVPNGRFRNPKNASGRSHIQRRGEHPLTLGYGSSYDV
jgi:hypothetical protein